MTESDTRGFGHYFNGRGITPQRPPDNLKMPTIVLVLCEFCHGRTGMGVVPEVPVIGRQHADYLISEFRSGKCESAMMGSVAAGLSDEDITAAGNFFSQQSYLSEDKFVAGLPHEKNPTETASSTSPKPAPAVVQRKTAQHLLAKMSMVEIKGGTFEMGSDKTDEDAPGYPKRTVALRAFQLGKYPVTFAEYDAFADATGRARPGDEGWGRDRYRVINVDWNDTIAFIEWLDKETGRHFRLPREAEREHTAHAGTSTNYWWGDQLDFSMFNSPKHVGRDRWAYPRLSVPFPRTHRTCTI